MFSATEKINDNFITGGSSPDDSFVSEGLHDGNDKKSPHGKGLKLSEAFLEDSPPPVAVPDEGKILKNIELLNDNTSPRSFKLDERERTTKNKASKDTAISTRFQKHNRSRKRFTITDADDHLSENESDSTPMLLLQTSPRSDYNDQASTASTGGGSVKGVTNAHTIDRRRNSKFTRQSSSFSNSSFRDDHATTRGLPHCSSFSSAISASSNASRTPISQCLRVKTTKGLRPSPSVASAARTIFQEIDEELSKNKSSKSLKSPPKSTRQQLKSTLSKASETLFGDNGFSDRYGNGESTVIPRTLLPHSVTYDTRAKQWVGTIATSQDKHGPKYCRVFFYDTEEEARASTLANAPPTMCNSDRCMNCNGKFAVFKRSYNCANCGSCVCQSCSDVSWPVKMVPPLYNKTIYSTVRVCISCDRLNKALKKSLLAGDLNQVIAVHVTGNVNLRRPFVDSKNTLYPIHCAVIGGNVEVVKWLIEQHRTPIYSSKGDAKAGKVSPLLTSKGQSLVYIAALNRNPEMLRYLIVERGVSLKSIKCLTTALAALNAVLHYMPRDNESLSVNSDFGEDEMGALIPHVSSDLSISSSMTTGSTISMNNARGNFDVIECAVERDITNNFETKQQAEENESEECVICFDRQIDCVMVPCGHQICCFQCASMTTNCPICKAKCTVIKIYRK